MNKATMRSAKLTLLTISTLCAGVWSNASADIISNSQSRYQHTVDGKFTNQAEWSDITPQTGQYSKVYYDYNGVTFFIMNDWFVNTAGSASDNYNEFIITADNGGKFNLKVFGDGTVDFTTNLTTPPPYQGAYTFGGSPNLSAPHTMWEIALDLGPGRILEDPNDPVGGGSPTVSPPVADPSFPGGMWVTLNQSGGTSSQPVPEPSSLILLGSGLGGIILKRRTSKKLTTSC